MKRDDFIEISFDDLATTNKSNKSSIKKLLGDGKKKDYILDIDIKNNTTEASHGYSWGLLGDFLDAYDAGNTDTNALRWAFISAIATIKGRDCWVNFGGQPLYPNMYTLITGDPGCGKSTAINAAKGLLDELGYPSRTPEIVDAGKLAYYFTREYKDQRINAMPMEDMGGETQSAARDSFLKSFTNGENTLESMQISDRFSGRQFTTRGRLEDLDHDSLAVVAGEYTGVFPPSAKWFVSKALIDLYDAPDHPTYEISEGVILDRPIMSMLAGVTPAGLSKTFETSDLNTGLLTRVMLVHSKHVEKSDPFAQRHDFKLSTDLITSLHKIYDLKGEITISDEARKVFKLISVAQLNSSYDIRLTFYYNRRSLHLTKIAMVLALLNNRVEIQRSDIVTANTLLLYNEFYMPKCLTTFANTPQIKIRNEIIDYLEQHMTSSKPITSDDIVTNVSAKLGVSRDALIITQLQRLHDSGMIMVLSTLEGANNYILNKPRNTDILQAVDLKIAVVEAIPEWDISNYADNDTDPLTTSGDLEL